MTFFIISPRASAPSFAKSGFIDRILSSRRCPRFQSRCQLINTDSVAASEGYFAERIPAITQIHAHYRQVEPGIFEGTYEVDHMESAEYFVFILEGLLGTRFTFDRKPRAMSACSMRSSCVWKTQSELRADFLRVTATQLQCRFRPSWDHWQPPASFGEK